MEARAIWASRSVKTIQGHLVAVVDRMVVAAALWDRCIRRPTPQAAVVVVPGPVVVWVARGAPQRAAAHHIQMALPEQQPCPMRSPRQIITCTMAMPV